MAARKSAEKELRWREILKRQADSGVSVREFCTAQGISEPSFYAWRRRLRTRDGARPRNARRRRDVSGNGELFVPLKLVDAAATLEIIHPLGYRIQVAGDVNPVALRHVIEALDESGVR